MSPEISESVIREYVEPATANALQKRARDRILNLSSREREILILLSEGLTNRDIAHILTISPETVKDHVRSVCTKLTVKNRLQAAYVAWQSGDSCRLLTA
ncbi:helix-turn-helix transcriptional regulator [Streptomyces sp. NPDC047071]|uniref:response regulator transcription factor n=1 Tax=Streptomyces sp. NPDC047071 TaxID=3154808 RepID=UPI0034551F0E